MSAETQELVFRLGDFICGFAFFGDFLNCCGVFSAKCGGTYDLNGFVCDGPSIDFFCSFNFKSFGFKEGTD